MNHIKSVTNQIRGMANDSSKLVIKIRPSVRGSVESQSTPHGHSATVDNVQGLQRSGRASSTKTGVLEFKIEGDRLSPGSVSNFYIFYTYMSFKPATTQFF